MNVINRKKRELNTVIKYENMNMQAVKLDGHTLCKGLDSCQGERKERKASFISFLPLMQNLAITDWSIYLKITIR